MQLMSSICIHFQLFSYSTVILRNLFGIDCTCFYSYFAFVDNTWKWEKVIRISYDFKSEIHCTPHFKLRQSNPNYSKLIEQDQIKILNQITL